GSLRGRHRRLRHPGHGRPGPPRRRRGARHHGSIAMKARIFALSLALVATALPALAAPPSAADGAAQRAVALSMDVVTRWADSMRALKAAEAHDPALKA